MKIDLSMTAPGRLLVMSLFLPVVTVGFFAVGWAGPLSGSATQRRAALDGVEIQHRVSGIDLTQPGWCGYKSSDAFLEELQDAVAQGLVPDPARSRRRFAPRMKVGATSIGPLGPDDIFPFEDTNGILLTQYSGSQLNGLMIQATQALLAQHGDQWDFIGFWMNFTPGTQNGAAAFYQPLFNDVAGIGSTVFDSRSSFGLGGTNIQGFVQEFNVWGWVPGDGFNANATRLVLGQEFEHRWAMFLNNLPGRPLQGNDGNCGRGAHWNFRVDGGGSGMEIAEWTGVNPAVKAGGALHFNSDIPNSVFSYPDLYLMGYVSPAEMDDSMAEFRYMDASPCGQQYSGAVSTITSADIIASNGTRNPTSATAQHDFKAAWIMFYQPGSPPTTADINQALGIMEQQQIDWNVGTLGRGTLDNSIAFGNFLTSPQSGPASLSVDFTYSSPFPTSAWKWYFGDGDSSTVENPSHTYGPGLFDVELRVQTDYGERYTLKQNHITVWADTCTAPDTDIESNSAGYVEIIGTNALPVEEFVFPITMTNVTSKFFLDSISFVGTRLGYFELQQVVFDNRFFGQLAVRVVADNGGGALPLPPGTGPVARVYFRSKINSVPGDTSFVTVGPMGSQTFTAVTTTTSYQPVFNGGTIRVVTPPCDCPFQGDFDANAVVDAVDLSSLIDIVFFASPDIQDPVCPTTRGDFNNDGSADAVDLSVIIDHVFFGGSGPVDPCL